MLQDNHIPLVIIAINSETEALDRNHLIVGLGVPVKHALEGKYTHDDGHTVTERSYLITLADVDETQSEALEKVAAVAHKHGQESILFLDNQRNAYLIYTQGGAVHPHHIGRFIGVSESIAKASDAYTFNPESREYFIVRGK